MIESVKVERPKVAHLGIAAFAAYNVRMRSKNTRRPLGLRWSQLHRIVALAALALLSLPASSSEEPALEEVTIVGEQAGPGLWKVRNGERTLYILGTLSPLPKKLQWRSREVESVMARADRLIPASGDVSVDVGPIRAVQLFMQYRKLRGNDDKETLDVVLPPELYERFETLRQKYAPRERGLSKLRPVLAAGELWREGIDRSGLTLRNDVNRSIEKLAKKAKVPIVKAKLRIDDPRGTLAEVGEIPLPAEIACMSATLDRLDTDLAAARERARAWSVGDVEVLRSPSLLQQQDACWSALLTSPKIAAIRRDFDRSWMELAIESLERYDTTLAVVPIIELFKRDGIVAMMRARGYTVEEP